VNNTGTKKSSIMK